MKDTILILTNSKEVAVHGVIEHLRNLEQNVVVVNTDELFKKIICLHSFGEINALINIGEQINLKSIKSVWYRRPELPEMPRMLSVDHRDFIWNEYRSLLWSLYTSIEAFWVNSPLIVRLLEHNKLYQMREASRIGLRVPETIISNNREELLSFCHKYGGRAALKTLHPVFIGQETKNSKFVFTNIISISDIEKNKDSIDLAPVFLQEYIVKELEFRVTVVGKCVFSCAIHSQNSERTKYDWRHYDFEKVKHEEQSLPPEIEGKLLILMEKLGLSYGAFDLILTPSQEYVFLEVNPNGQWEWVEVLTGMPISKKIAELLTAPPANH